MGNGPSLRHVDLKSLSEYSTIGLNAAYRYWREINWRPTYYACLDTVVGLSHQNEIRQLIEEGRIEKFLLRENLIETLGPASGGRVINFDALRFHIPLLRSPNVTTGSHAALWASSMGYNKIVLLGIDAQYTEIVSGARRSIGIEVEIVEKSENPNYFFDDYQRPGDRYHLPNPMRGLHVDAWREVAALLKNKKVAVFNGNPSSAVRVFPYIDLAELLNGGSVLAPATEAVSEDMAFAAAATRKIRFVRFFRAHFGVLLAGFLFACASGIALTHMGMGSGLWLLTLCIFYFLFVAVCYMRSTTIAHMRVQDARLERTEAALRDVLRVLPRSDQD